jgi:hypothetical protein
VSSPAVPWQRLLIVEIIQLPRSHHSRLANISQLNSLLQTVLLLTSRHGPQRKHPVSIAVIQLLQLPSKEYVFTEPLLTNDIAYSSISLSLHSNGCTLYSIIPPCPFRSSKWACLLDSTGSQNKRDRKGSVRTGRGGVAMRVLRILCVMVTHTYIYIQYK